MICPKPKRTVHLIRPGEALVLVGFVAVSLLAGGCRSFEIDEVPAYPEEGLLLHYSFDHVDGIEVQDRSGNGLHATLHGNARWVRGIVGGAVAFDGTAHTFAEREDGAGLFAGLSAVTLAAWVKSDSTHTDAGFFICELPEGHDRALTLRYDAEGAASGESNGIKGGITLHTGAQLNFETQSHLQSTSWQHLVMTWESGRSFQLYVDGYSVEPVVNPVRQGTLGGMSRILVGKGSKDAGSSWSGMVDELFIYRRVLTPDEVEVLYRRGAP